MLCGELYNPLDKTLSNERLQAQLLLRQYNNTPENEKQKLKQLLQKLIPKGCQNTWINAPFLCDYGYNIQLEKGVFINFNCIFLDAAPINIGSKTLIGPNVQIYTSTHPMEYQLRATNQEYAFPVKIGKNVWIGGNATLCPGVTIGDCSVIGAGSVVTRSIPANVFAAGNPCKIIHSLNNS